MTEAKTFVFVFGGPGSEKAVLCERVAKDLEGWSHVSVGDLLRKEAETSSERGQQCRESINAGELVSGEVVTDILEAEIQKAGGSKFIIDGFPRSAAQVEEFEKRIGKIDYGIVLETSDEVMTSRLAERCESSNREDDKPEIAEKRISAFKQDVVPFIDTLKSQGKDLVVIGGDGDVFDEIKKAVEEVDAKIIAKENPDAPVEPETPIDNAEAEEKPAEVSGEKIEEETPKPAEVEASETNQGNPDVSESNDQGEEASAAPVVGEESAETPPVEESPVDDKPEEAEPAELANGDVTEEKGEPVPAEEAEVVKENGDSVEKVEADEVVTPENDVGDNAEQGSEKEPVGVNPEESQGEEEIDQGRDEEEAAATRIQAVHRGRQARKKVDELKKSTKVAKEEMDENPIETNAEPVAVESPAPQEQGESTEEKLPENSKENPSPADAAPEVDVTSENAQIEPETADPDNSGEENLGETGQSEADVVLDTPSPDNVANGEEENKDPTEVLVEETAEIASTPKEEAVDNSQEAELAATKIQSIQRGRKARKEVNALKETRRIEHEKSTAAATKIQSVQRGRKARKEVEGLRTTRRLQVEKEQKQQQVAATKIQSVQRGRKARKDVEELKRSRREAEQLRLKKEREGAARRIQAVQRGRVARENVKEMKRVKGEQEKAAVRIQSVQRGRAARKEVDELRSQRRAALEREKILAMPGKTESPKSKREREKISCREYMDATITPLLRDGLKVLNKERPADPVQFLINYLMDGKKALASRAK